MNYATTKNYGILELGRGGTKMKKYTILALFILLLAACNSPQSTSPAKEEVNEEEEQQQVEETPNEEVDTEDEKEAEPEEETNNPADSNDANTESPTLEEKEPEKKEDPEKELVDLTKKIFAAQNSQDYAFLESVLSKGSKLDKKNNTFTFNNVTYPHKQEFITEKNAGKLEFRYTHENSPDSFIVGYGAIDYENESSFVIDFEFIREDEKWKMNDMDINK